MSTMLVTATPDLAATAQITVTLTPLVPGPGATPVIDSTGPPQLIPNEDRSRDDKAVPAALLATAEAAPEPAENAQHGRSPTSQQQETPQLGASSDERPQPNNIQRIQTTSQNGEDTSSRLAGSGYMPTFIQGAMGEWTGSAVASIPIDVPPGPAGHAPALTLSYSSNTVEDVYFQGGKNDPSEVALQMAASPFGYGWDLAGIPSISRAGHSAYFGDTQRGGFEISIGGETTRLIKRVVDTSTATPGPTPTSGTVMTKQRILYQTYPQRFLYVARTTNQTEDSKVCGYEPYYRESRWEVITSDGTHYEFGGRDNTQLTAQHDCMPVNPDDYNAVQFMISGGPDIDLTVLPSKWYVTKITDVHGNVIRFKYRKESFSDPNNQGQQYPREGQYDAAVTLAEVSWGGTDPTQHRAKIVVVPQTYARADNILSINKAEGRRNTATAAPPTPTSTLTPQTPIPPPTNTPVWEHWRVGTQLEANNPPGYMSGYLIDRIEVKVKQNTYPGGGGTPTPEWVTLRTYNLEYAIHHRSTGMQYDRALLDKVILADGDVVQPSPVPTGGTPTPATALPNTSTPAPTAKATLPPFKMTYATTTSDINWLPLSSFDNGSGGKVEYAYISTPTPVSCWNPYERVLHDHRRRPVLSRKVYDRGTPISTSNYVYAGGACSEKFSEDTEGALGYWYEFLGFGTVQETTTDHTLSPTAVAQFVSTDYYRCRGDSTGAGCIEATATATPPGGTPTASYFGNEPHPNKGAVKRRQVAQNASTAVPATGTAMPDIDDESVYVVDDLVADYIGYSTTSQVTSPWGRLDRSITRRRGRTALQPSGTPTYAVVSSVTEYKYDPGQQGGKQWGNVTRIREYLSESNYPSSPYRTERTWYNTKEQINKFDFSPTASIYIVDRPRSRALLKDAGALPIDTPTPAATNEAREIEWFTYDGNLLPTDGLGSSGALTRHARLERVSSFPPGVNPTLTANCSGNVEKYRTVDDMYTYVPPTPTVPAAGGNVLTQSTFSGYGYACVVNPFAVGESVYVDNLANTPKGKQQTSTDYDTVLNALPVSITNPKSHTETYQYFGINSTAQVSTEGYFSTQLHTVTDANTNQTTYAFDRLGRIVKLVKPGDSLVSPSMAYGYSEGAPTPMTTPFPVLHSVWTKREPGTSPWSDGGSWERTFIDGRGQVLESQHPHFDWKGNPAAPTPTAAATAIGQDVVVHRSYDALGNLVSVTNPYLKSAYNSTTGINPYVTPISSQYKTTTTFDAMGRPLDTLNPDSTHIYHNYYVIDGAPSLWVDDTIDQRKHRSQTRTDSLGRLSEVREYLGNCSGVSGWFPCTTPTPYATSWSSDGQASTTSYQYNIEDQLVQSSDPESNLIGITYDLFGRKTELTDPDMGTWKYVYDAAGNVTLQVDGRSQGVCRFYDELSRETQRRYVAGATPSPCTANEATGTPTPMGTAGPSMGYDSGTNGKGHRTSMSLPDGSSYSWTYDGLGRVSRETQYLSGQGTGTYNTDYTYKSNGEIETLKHPDTLDTLNYTYNIVGLKTIQSAPTAQSSGHPDQWFVSRTDYTADGRVDWRNLGPTATAVVQDSDYNANDLRLYRIRAGTGATAPHYKEYMDHYYTYDEAGNCTQLDDWSSGAPMRMSLVYDDRDRLTSAQVTGGNGGYGNYGPDSYSYDPKGNITTKDGLKYDPHAAKIHAVRRVYGNGTATDTSMSIKARKTSSCASTVYVDAIVNGTYQSTAYINGTGSSFVSYSFGTVPLTGNDVISLGFDSGTPNELESVPGCDVDVDSLTIGGVTLEMENGRAAFDKGAYTYPTWGAAVDGDNVVAPPEASTYITVEQEGALRFVRGTSAAAYEYEANGNMYWRIIDGSAFELLWDAENRLSEIKKNDTGGKTEAKFTYDADGKRIKAQRDTKYSLYVGDLYEYTENCPGAGGTNCGKSDVVSYYYANGDPVAMYQGTQWTGRSLYWRMSDHLGSTSRTITASPPGIRADSMFKAWGEYRFNSGTQATTRQFTGQRKEPSDGTDIEGLYYYNARYYEPNAGRFISPDALVPDPGLSISLNRYAYANDNPIRYRDPSGHFIDEVADFAFIAYDVHEIRDQGWSWSTGLPLAADVAGALVPFATGGGIAVRGAMHADDVIKVASHTDEALHAVVSAAEHGDEALGAVVRAEEQVAAKMADSGFGNLSRAEEYGVQTYRDLKAAKRGKETGLEAHHLVEARFADRMGQTEGSMLSVAVTRAEHQIFTNKWRAAIPYGGSSKLVGRIEIERAAREIYEKHPAILRALGLE